MYTSDPLAVFSLGIGSKMSPWFGSSHQVLGSGHNALWNVATMQNLPLLLVGPEPVSLRLQPGSPGTHILFVVYSIMESPSELIDNRDILVTGHERFFIKWKGYPTFHTSEPSPSIPVVDLLQTLYPRLIQHDEVLYRKVCEYISHYNRYLPPGDAMRPLGNPYLLTGELENLFVYGSRDGPVGFSRLF
jgi:hypothetical protein